MFEAFQKWTDESQRMSKEGFDAALRSYGELNKGFQAITAKVTDYSKKVFEDPTRGALSTRGGHCRVNTNNHVEVIQKGSSPQEGSEVLAPRS
jgi:hypothetical protein